MITYVIFSWNNDISTAFNIWKHSVWTFSSLNIEVMQFSFFVVTYFCNVFMITEHTNLFEWWYVLFYIQSGWYIFIFIFDAWLTRSRSNIKHASKFFLDWLHVSAGLQLKTWFIQSRLLGGGWMWHCGIARALRVWCGTARTTWMQMKWC